MSTVIETTTEELYEYIDSLETELARLQNETVNSRNEIGSLKRSIAAFKANSTRRRAAVAVGNVA